MSKRSRKGKFEATLQTVKFFETLMHAWADGIVITDATQNIVVVNEAFCAFFGRRWRDVIETNLFTWLEQLDADAPRRWAELEKRVRLEGTCRDVEFPMRCPEPVEETTKDEVRYLSVNASLLEQVAGEESGIIISVWRDITERVRAEEEVKRRNEELAALNAIAATVSRSLDLDEMLNSALDKVLEVMRIDAGEILLLGEQSEELVVSAQRGFSQEYVEGGNRIRLGEGMMGQVAQSGKPMIVQDVADDPRLTRMMVRREELRSAVVVPLRAKDKVLGIMDIVSRDYRQFTPQDVQLLTSIGNQIGVAIENAQLLEGERKKATELEAVNQVAREIVSILDLDRLLSDVTSLINQTFGYYHVAIMLVDPASDDLVFKTAAGGYAGKTPPEMRQKKKEGLIGWAAYLGETILANDVSLDPRFIPAYLPETRSELDIPLKIGNRVIGVLDVQSKELNAFTEDDKRVLETLADQIAIAIENAQLYEERKAQSERISALYRIDQALISTIDLEQTLQLVMKEMSAAISVNRCSLWLLDESGQAVVGTADLQPETEKAPSIIGMKLRLSDEPLAEKILSEGQPIVVNDVHDPAWTHLITKEYIETFRLKSFLVVPLESKGQRKGFIVLDDSREHHLFTPDEVAMAVSAARQASIAIENARLFEETKQRLQELAMLYQVGVGVTGTLKLDHVLQLIVDSAIEAIPAAEKGSLFLPDEESNELVIRAARGYSPEAVEKVKLKVGEGYAGWAVQERQPLVIERPETDPRTKDFNDLEEVVAIKSAVAVPLEVKGRVIGALTLDNVTSYSAFSESDLQLLSTFASQAAIAIENAQLFEQAQQEIAERKRAEKELQESKQRLELALRGGDLGLWDWNVQTGEVVFNQRWAEMLGYSLEEIEPHVHTWQNLLHPDDMPGVMEVLNAHLDGKTPFYESEYRLLAKSGEWKWILDRGRVFERDKDGKPLRAAGTHLDITERKRAQEELQQSYVKLQRSLEGTVHALASTTERRDPYTAGHQQRVTQLACAIAQEMSLPEEQIEGLRVAGTLHDIGKIYVPAEILSKPGRLTETEFSLIKTHPQIGYDILKTIEFPWPVAPIVVQHHERMDGSGYPQGLSGDDILMEARILGVADVVEAMASHRPYREARGLDAALEEISQNRDILYDPKVVDACLRLFTEKGFEFE